MYWFEDIFLKIKNPTSRKKLAGDFLVGLSEVSLKNM